MYTECVYPMALAFDCKCRKCKLLQLVENREGGKRLVVGVYIALDYYQEYALLCM